MPTKTKREKLAISFFQETGADIRRNITVLPELQNLIPPLSEEEFDQLKQNILANGCREPMTLWRHDGQSVLIDGHNRYRICTEHNVAFEFIFYDFDGLDQAKDWMLANQLGRRNLTTLQQSYLRGKRYANEKQAHGGFRVSRDQVKRDPVKRDPVRQNAAPTPTASQLAQEYGVNEKTIRRDEQFALGLEKLTKDDNSLRWRILNGQIKAGKKTVAALTTQKASQLSKIKKQVQKTGNLDQAVRLTREPTPPTVAPASPSEVLIVLKKQIIATTARAIRSGSSEDIVELRQLVDQLDLALK